MSDEVAVSGGDQSLQTEMTGDFFHDEGVDAVVDSRGITQLNENNEPIRTMDEFSTFKAKKSAPVAKPTQTGQPSAAPVAQPKPGDFEALFNKNGQLDFDALNAQANRFSQFKYVPTAAQPPAAQQPAAVKVEPVEKLKTEVNAYQTELEKTHLAPFQSAWKRLVAKYGSEENIPFEVNQALNEQYAEQRDAVKAMVDAKKDELKDKQYAERDTQRNFEDVKKTSEATYNSVAQEFLPGAPVGKHGEMLNQLIFGQIINGTLTNGYGVDAVNHIFDMHSQGKAYKTNQEWVDAYNKFWVEYTSNPNNVRWIAKVAWNAFDKAQETKRRDAYRASWDKEAKAKGLNSTVQPPKAGRGGNSMQGDAAMQELNNFLSVPKPNQ